ncbi:MAG: putative nucleotidyltransferase [Bacteroidia bacterium]|jgi:predicted nucleotidyltransferase
MITTVKVFVLIILSAIAFASVGQVQGLPPGTYVGKFELNGFEDTLVFTGDTLTIKQDLGWYYGISHIHVYLIASLEGDSIQLKFIAHLIDGFSNEDALRSELDNRIMRINHLENDKLLFFDARSQIEDVGEFELLHKEDD